MHPEFLQQQRFERWIITHVVWQIYCDELLVFGQRCRQKTIELRGQFIRLQMLVEPFHLFAWAVIFTDVDCVGLQKCDSLEHILQSHHVLVVAQFHPNVYHTACRLHRFVGADDFVALNIVTLPPHRYLRGRICTGNCPHLQLPP